ncbi:MAG: transaldolase [Oscillospiraceae bacterium]|nr:transaldolase [Oscillospiraceae bacterium]
MIKYYLGSLGAAAAKGEEDLVNRVLGMEITEAEFMALSGRVRHIGAGETYKDVMATFPTETGTPAGFRREIAMRPGGLALVDLVRDISYDADGARRPTNVLFSADSANPYEVAPISPFIANLTCNPGIVYDLFINNPKANVGGQYKTRDEVMAEIGRILGPGCDISVELNNPFENDFGAILEEVSKFREMFSKYRVVIKVPHTGAVTDENVEQLLNGDKTLDKAFYDVTTGGALRGHALALKLQQLGYRINFTLMFEPYQTLFALQARPYFINSFIRHRLVQTGSVKNCIDLYNESGDLSHLEDLRNLFLKNDYYPPSCAATDLLTVKRYGEDIIRYRRFDCDEGSDGLDGVRHNLRALRNCNLPDTRLIICSMEGDYNYPDIDKLLTDPEFQDMNDKVVITAEPNYIARFTSTNQVTSYQRRFMNAAKGMA